jgi:tetratricopeptide (TPR) repeat protein
VAALCGLLGVGALALYLRTLAPSLPTGDSGDFISASYVLGVAHPPGYPLYTMLGHLATLLPVGNPALRINLTSALFGALAVGLVGALIARIVLDAGRRPAALAAAVITGAVALAVSTAFWSYSIVTEAFALNAALAALILLLAVMWWQEPRRFRLLWALGLVGGLSLAHHQTIILLGPAVLLLLAVGLRRLGVFGVRPQSRASSRRRDRPRAGEAPVSQRAAIAVQFAFSAALVLVGLAAYLYLPLAASSDPPINWGDPDTPERFFDVVTRAHYGTFSLTAEDRLGSPLEHVRIFFDYLWRAFGPLGLGLAVLGVVGLRRRPLLATALVLGVLFAGPLFVAYANPAISSPIVLGILERFAILPSVPLAVLIGVGAATAVSMLEVGARRAGGRIGRPSARFGPALAGAVLVGLTAAIIPMRLSEVDQTGNLVAETYARDVLGLLEPDAILLMRGDENQTSIGYARHALGMRPDVAELDVELLKLASYVSNARARYPAVDIPFDEYDEGETASLSELVTANIDRHPVYLVGDLKATEPLAGYSLKRYGLVRRIVPASTGGGDYSLVAADRARLESVLHFPQRLDPPTTWERLLEANYGLAAFDLGYVAYPADPQTAADWYRRTIALDPTHASAYLNLGLIVLQSGGPTDEVVRLWSEFLALRPDDPQSEAVRQQLAALQSAGGPAPTPAASPLATGAATQ